MNLRCKKPMMSLYFCVFLSISSSIWFQFPGSVISSAYNLISSHQFFFFSKLSSFSLLSFSSFVSFHLYFCVFLSISPLILFQFPGSVISIFYFLLSLLIFSLLLLLLFSLSSFSLYIYHMSCLLTLSHLLLSSSLLFMKRS